MSCHCINWLSETLCEEKLQLLGSWRWSDNDGEMNRRGGRSQGQKGGGSEVKIGRGPRSVLNKIARQRFQNRRRAGQ